MFITRVVVPLDRSELAAQALPAACELARLSASSIHLVHVIDVTRLDGYGMFGLALAYGAADELVAVEDAESRAYLEKVARDLTDRGLTVTTDISRGVVHRALNELTQPGDVIVMSSHGRGGLTRWFLGSVAEEVVRHAKVPVMLIRAVTPAPEHAELASAVANGS